MNSVLHISPKGKVSVVTKEEKIKLTIVSSSDVCHGCFFYDGPFEKHCEDTPGCSGLIYVRKGKA